MICQFNRDRISSDGGAILLKAADRRLGMIRRLSETLPDYRASGKIDHTLEEILVQRIYAIACGQPDCNDAAHLADDPVHKVLAGRTDKDAPALASQSTLSRFENSLRARDLYRMSDTLADIVVEHHRKRRHGRARRITLDLDPTEDPTHGQQELTFYSGFYRSHCYLPLLGFMTFDNEPDQYMFAAMLRPGNAPAFRGSVALLERIFAKLRVAFPKAEILVRLDGAFACEQVFAFLESENVKFVANMAKNSVLKKKAEKLMRRVRRKSKASGRTENEFGECRYAAAKWSRKRRVIIKAEKTVYPGRPARDNPRFVVTNLTQTPRHVFKKKYCKRGDAENRIKELKDLHLDRTSCSSFLANQFRILLTMAAFILMQEIRARAARTSMARAQVTTIIQKLIKIGVQVSVSVRRIVFDLPCAHPERKAFIQIAEALAIE